MFFAVRAVRSTMRSRHWIRPSDPRSCSPTPAVCRSFGDRGPAGLAARDGQDQDEAGARPATRDARGPGRPRRRDPGRSRSRWRRGRRRAAPSTRGPVGGGRRLPLLEPQRRTGERCARGQLLQLIDRLGAAGAWGADDRGRATPTKRDVSERRELMEPPLGFEEGASSAPSATRDAQGVGCGSVDQQVSRFVPIAEARRLNAGRDRRLMLRKPCPDGHAEGWCRVDRDLVEMAQRGDRDAFGVLARTSADRLFAVAQRILRDVGRAEDAVQQTLVIAWRRLPQLRDPDRFDAWIYRLLIHECYAEARNARQWGTPLQLLPADRAQRDETLSVADRDELDRGFRRLPPDQRSILVLRHYLGLSPAEIAETLGIPEGTARSRLHYAHRAMRAALAAAERPMNIAEGRSS